VEGIKLIGVLLHRCGELKAAAQEKMMAAAF
jgi:hypothetical protein